jgi:hypothetical protein
LTTNEPHQNDQSVIVPTVVDVAHRMRDDSGYSRGTIEPRGSDSATSEVSLHESLSDSAVLHSPEDTELLQAIRRLSEDFNEAAANAILLRNLLEPPSLKGVQDGSTDSAVLVFMQYRRSMLIGKLARAKRLVILSTARAVYVTELLKLHTDNPDHTKFILNPELAGLMRTIGGVFGTLSHVRSFFRGQLQRLQRLQAAKIARSSSATSSATDLDHLEFMQWVEDTEHFIMGSNTNMQPWLQALADARAALRASIESSISDSPTKLRRHISRTSLRARRSKMALPAHDDDLSANHDAEQGGASHFALARQPRTCRNCGSEFATDDHLHKHLEMCRRSGGSFAKRVKISTSALTPQVNENQVDPHPMNHTGLPSVLKQGTQFSQDAIYPDPSSETRDSTLQGKTLEQELVSTGHPEDHRQLRHGVYLEV